MLVTKGALRQTNILPPCNKVIVSSALGNNFWLVDIKALWHRCHHLNSRVTNLGRSELTRRN